jgi:hypothetical protein
MLSLHDFAHCLSGRVISGGVSFCPPNHRPGDMSARILLDPNMRNGYRVASLAGDDPLVLRDDAIKEGRV